METPNYDLTNPDVHASVYVNPNALRVDRTEEPRPACHVTIAPGVKAVMFDADVALKTADAFLLAAAQLEQSSAAADDEAQSRAAFHLLEGCCIHDLGSIPCCFCDIRKPCSKFLADFATWQAEREARADQAYRDEVRAAAS